MTTLHPPDVHGAQAAPGTAPGRGGRGAGEAVTASGGSSAGDGPAAERIPLLARPLASYYLVLSSAGLLLALGLVMVLSASSVNSFRVSGSSYSVFLKQLMWVSLGLPLLVIACRLPVRAFRTLSYPLLLASLVGLVLVLVPGIGRTVLGSSRWIGVGPFTIQPSELAKLALAIWGADLLVRKRRLLAEWRHLLVPILPVATLVYLLVMLEPDMGTTLVLVVVVLALLWVVGSPLRLFTGLLGTLALLGTALAVTEPYRLARLTSFADPFRDAQDGGYQAVQGLYALASGGWWGLGLGASREKWQYLPNAHTDFILAVIGEELGLVGTVLVLVLFAVLAYGGIRVAQRSADPFGRLAAAAVTAWLIGQAFINIGAVVGLVPITGIPLPLISFGGSSLVPTMFAIGMLLALAKTEPAAAQVVARRAARRSARRMPRRPEALLQRRRRGAGGAAAASAREPRRGEKRARSAGRQPFGGQGSVREGSAGQGSVREAFVGQGSGRQGSVRQGSGRRAERRVPGAEARATGARVPSGAVRRVGGRRARRANR